METRMSKLPPATHFDRASWALSLFGIFFVLIFHLLPALIAGLLVYELVHALFPLFTRHLSTRRAKLVAVGLVALLVILAVTAASFGVVFFMRSEGGSLSALLAKMADIIESSRATLPQALAAFLPKNTGGIRDIMSQWLREHAAELQLIGKATGHMLAHVLIGMVIGAMVSLREACDKDHDGPLSSALAERVFRMGEAFRRIVFAQVRISALNTTFTAMYLAVVLPMFGVHLPLTKTMIVVTFLAGMLPVIGNLISNSVIFVVSLAHSPAVAMSSLVYLIVIHKLEYFLNARIVGSQISAKAWELLTAMLVMESAFGLPGLVAAPICYAWLKDELKARELL
ncbi:MAG: AI-2E family transporter [Propionivibrio sp.]|nr:AI-2E family transporter [Propionivibrio sp.]